MGYNVCNANTRADTRARAHTYTICVDSKRGKNQYIHLAVDNVQPKEYLAERAATEPSDHTVLSATNVIVFERVGDVRHFVCVLFSGWCLDFDKQKRKNTAIGSFGRRAQFVDIIYDFRLREFHSRKRRTVVSE